MKKYVSMIVFIVLLGSGLAFLLSWVDDYTGPMIARNLEFKEKTSILNAFGISYTEENIFSVFSNSITVLSNEKGEKVYRAMDGSGAWGFPLEGSGFQDRIYAFLAVKADLTTIHGITIIEQKETPGLGGRIIEEDFLASFLGKKALPRLAFLKPGEPTDENQVNSITGATMTCNQLEAIINGNVPKYTELIRSMKP